MQDNVDWQRLKEIRERCTELEREGKAEEQEHRDLVEEYCRVLHASPITEDDIKWAQGKE
jgi:hypothetical protein